MPEAVGGVSGWIGGLGAFGGFVVPPILGAIVAGQGDVGYQHGFGLFIGLAVLALVMTALFKQAPGAPAQSRPAA